MSTLSLCGKPCKANWPQLVQQSPSQRVHICTSVEQHMISKLQVSGACLQGYGMSVQLWVSPDDRSIISIL